MSRMILRKGIRVAVVLLFLTLNLGIASQAQAALDNDICVDGEGQPYLCCTFCLIFCSCQNVE